MNYIPGFSNYLETTAPRYARGGPARFVEDDIYGGGYDGSPLMYSDPMAAAAPITDTYQQAAVAPMATEVVSPAVSPVATTPAATTSAGAVAPYDLSALAGLDLSGLDSLYGMNFGTDFGGGAMGGQYQVDPNVQYIGAPLSNKGNATSQTGGNVFAVRVDQPVRLYDHRTNQVVFEGTGFDAARKATELGQNLSDTQGRKANYSIQTADPAGNYSTVAYEKKNKSTLGQIANAVGTVAPLALMAIPGAGPALFGMSQAAFAGSAAAQAAFGALVGAASSGLKGQNILKGAALGGLTAAGGALIPKIPAIGDLGNLARPIGTGIGATAGGLATGQSLKNSLLGGAASGALAYAAPGIQKSLGIGQGPNLSTGGGDTSVSTGANAASGPAPIATVTGNTGFSAPVSFGGGSTPQTKPAADKMAEENLIKVTGSLPGTAPSVNLGGGLSSPILDRIAQPAETSSPEPTLEELLVEARKSFTPPVNVNPSNVTRANLNTATEPTLEELLVEARKSFTPPVNIGTTTGGTAPAENPLIKVTGRLPTTTPPVSVGTTTGGTTAVEDPLIKVTGRQTTTPPVLWGVEKPLPDLSKTDADAEAEKKKKLEVEDYLRLASLATGLVGNLTGGGKDGSGSSGTYIPGGAGSGRLNPIFSAQLPAAGGLGSIGATRTARQLGDVDWLTYGTRPELKFFDYSTTPANPAPVTSPVPGNPAGPIMQQRDPTAMAEGGALAAKRGGQSRRTEFAVNGPGTGRSDEIPAVLSDGEYVIDAETVALLGDGSSKAGAKKLDELRVKVRKHKGKKLAKGRFSANAKKPEAYLSGGRV